MRNSFRFLYIGKINSRLSRIIKQCRGFFGFSYVIQESVGIHEHFREFNLMFYFTFKSTRLIRNISVVFERVKYSLSFFDVVQEFLQYILRDSLKPPPYQSFDFALIAT